MNIHFKAQNKCFQTSKEDNWTGEKVI